MPKWTKWQCIYNSTHQSLLKVEMVSLGNVLTFPFGINYARTQSCDVSAECTYTGPYVQCTVPVFTYCFPYDKEIQRTS